MQADRVYKSRLNSTETTKFFVLLYHKNIQVQKYGGTTNKERKKYCIAYTFYEYIIKFTDNKNNLKTNNYNNIIVDETFNYIYVVVAAGAIRAVVGWF